MPKRKKKDVFSVTKAVKANARAVVGTPKATQEIPDAKTRQRKRATKHKKTLGEMLSSED